MEPTKFTVELPRASSKEEVTCQRSLLIIGANGSGKTRLGTWLELESPARALVHRISAQKSLSMPESAQIGSLELAENDLLFGSATIRTEPEKHHHKLYSRMGRNPAIGMLDDFHKLLAYLFSEHAEESAKYLAASKRTDKRIAPPTTKLDKVKTVWEATLPHRELIVGGARVQTRAQSSANDPYSASEMSDGERVVFYLVGQCLAAPSGGIVVIDEPELHLHRSIQTTLWATVQELRSDCLFVYLTHDVDFAATLGTATRVWLKSFDGKQWEWEIVERQDELPDALLLEVLGSRKPVLFVEGEKGSYDYSLYQALFPGYLVIPRGGCGQVIESVRALRRNKPLHRLEVSGLIDRDRRGDAEVLALETEGVFVLGVAEVESLFCTEEVVRLVSEKLARDPDTDYLDASSAIFDRLSAEIEAQARARVGAEIKHKLSCFTGKARSAATLQAELNALLGSIDVETMQLYWEDRLKDAIAQRDYEGLLRIYNRKSLADDVGAVFGFRTNGLQEFVIRLAASSERLSLRNAMGRYLGGFRGVAFGAT